MLHYIDTWYNDNNKIIIANYGAPELYFPVTTTLLHVSKTHSDIIYAWLCFFRSCLVDIYIYIYSVITLKDEKNAIILIVHQCIYKIIIDTVVPVSMDMTWASIKRPFCCLFKNSTFFCSCFCLLYFKGVSKK